MDSSLEDFDGDALQASASSVKPSTMDRSMEDSISIGDIMNHNSSDILIPSGSADDVLLMPPAPPPVPEGLLGGLFHRVKNMVKTPKDDDNPGKNAPEQQRSMNSLGESGQSSRSRSTAAGGYFMPQASAKRYVFARNVSHDCYQSAFIFFLDMQLTTNSIFRLQTYAVNWC